MPGRVCRRRFPKQKHPTSVGCFCFNNHPEITLRKRNGKMRDDAIVPAERGASERLAFSRCVKERPRARRRLCCGGAAQTRTSADRDASTPVFKAKSNEIQLRVQPNTLASEFEYAEHSFGDGLTNSLSVTSLDTTLSYSEWSRSPSAHRALALLSAAPLAPREKSEIFPAGAPCEITKCRTEGIAIVTRSVNRVGLDGSAPAMRHLIAPRAHCKRHNMAAPQRRRPRTPSCPSAEGAP